MDKDAVDIMYTHNQTLYQVIVSKWRYEFP